MDIQEISDRMEIDVLLNKYTDAIDSQSWDDLDNVFTPDAELDYTEVGGTKGSFPEVKAWLAKTLVVFPLTQHMIGKTTIKLDGDIAECQTLVHNPMVLPVNDAGKYDADGKGRSTFFVGSWYLDTCTRTDKGWRISKKYERAGFFFGDMPPGMPVPE